MNRCSIKARSIDADYRPHRRQRRLQLRLAGGKEGEVAGPFDLVEFGRSWQRPENDRGAGDEGDVLGVRCCPELYRYRDMGQGLPVEYEPQPGCRHHGYPDASI